MRFVKLSIKWFSKDFLLPVNENVVIVISSATILCASFVTNQWLITTQNDVKDGELQQLFVESSKEIVQFCIQCVLIAWMIALLSKKVQSTIVKKGITVLIQYKVG